jgi:diamine N-acetyltransferase
MTALRRATADDAPALAALGRETFVDTFVHGFAIPYPPDDLEAYLAEAFSASALRDRLAVPGDVWWLVEDGGRLLAFAHAGHNALPHPDGRPEHAELKRLYVAKAAQGQGHGRRLFEVALGWMGAHTSGPMWIGVWSGNHKAQRFYAHYGFAKAGEYDYPVGRWLDREFILRRG